MNKLPHKPSALLRYAVKCQDEAIRNGIDPDSSDYGHPEGRCCLAGAVVLKYNPDVDWRHFNEWAYDIGHSPSTEQSIVGLINSFRKLSWNLSSSFKYFKELELTKYWCSYRQVLKSFNYQTDGSETVNYKGLDSWRVEKSRLLNFANKLEAEGA